MNPEQLSAKNTEHGQQAALMAWAAMATLCGFEIADEMSAYESAGFKKLITDPFYSKKPVAALRWLHAIPNGGARDPVTAARLKAEGVKPGVPDLFLPVAKWLSPSYAFHGLYIEMKKGKSGRQSKEQIEFEEFCTVQSFRYVECRSWREAADAIKEYLLT